MRLPLGDEAPPGTEAFRPKTDEVTQLAQGAGLGYNKKTMRWRIQTKLIAAFLFIGLIPMVISTLIVVSINARRIEAEIEKSVRDASKKTMMRLDEYKKASSHISRLLVSNPDFVMHLRKSGQPQVIQTRHPLVLWIPGEVSTGSGEDIVQLKEYEGLIAGTITPIANETLQGNLVVGYQLGKSFSQDMSALTGVEVYAHHKNPGGRGDRQSNKEKLIEEAFSRGQGCYISDDIFHKKHFQAFYQPLQSKGGTNVGMIFFGVPRRYGFRAVVGARSFFPILIGLCVAVAGGLGYAISKRISRPLQMFARGAEQIADGNLDQEIKIETGDELGELSSAFNLMTRKLRHMRQLEEELRRKDKLAALGELSAGVAHEIRNPLGIIRNSAEVLQGKLPSGDKRRRLTDFIIGEVDRLNKVVSSFLDFAKPQMPDKEECNINELIDKNLRLLEPAVLKTKVNVVKNYSAELTKTLVDPGQISQVFLNLILNAVQSMADGGSLTITSQPRQAFSEVEVSFTDTGCGIRQELLDKIFNPFFSAREGGIGLGLAIVHKLVDAHDGDISVKNNADAGCTFTVRLPYGNNTGC